MIDYFRVISVSKHSSKKTDYKNTWKVLIQKILRSTAEFVAKDSTLKGHMITHTREKPYTWQFCEKEFNLNANLHGHIASRHSVTPSLLFVNYVPRNTKWRLLFEIIWFVNMIMMWIRNPGFTVQSVKFVLQIFEPWVVTWRST